MRELRAKIMLAMRRSQVLLFDPASQKAHNRQMHSLHNGRESRTLQLQKQRLQLVLVHNRLLRRCARASEQVQVSGLVLEKDDEGRHGGTLQSEGTQLHKVKQISVWFD